MIERPLATLPCECVDQHGQVLPRFDGADVENRPRSQSVAPANPLQRRRVADRPERGRRRLVDDVHPSPVEAVQPFDVTLRALGNSEDGCGSPDREIHQRPVQQDAPRRMESWQQPKAHVVNGDDGGHAGRNRHHAVGEMRDVRGNRFQRRRGACLHPDQPRHPRGFTDDANALGERRRCLDRAVRQHQQLVVRSSRLGEVLQQVFGVVADPGPIGPKRGPVKRDAHPGRSPERRQRQSRARA
jgi:hypothetical protein